MTKLTYQDASGKVTDIPIDPNKPLLRMLEDAGIEYPFSCLTGICGICRIKVLKGQDKLDPQMHGQANVPLAEDEVLACVAGISEEAASQEDLQIQLKSTE